MIRLGLHLSLGGGREAVTRQAAITAGVMIGVALLLFMIAGLNLLAGNWERPCWRCTGQTERSIQGQETTNPLHWRKQETVYNAKIIASYDIAQTGPNSPQIPGIPHLPGPGEYYASPALTKLLRQAPDDQLDRRFPGKLTGEIGRAGLDGPKDLVAVVGRTPAELPLTPTSTLEETPTGANGFTYEVWKVNDQPLKRNYGPFIMALFGIGVIGLLISVTTLIATATRLSASRREEKFAALRLFGATPQQINQFAAIDAVIGASVGAILGLGLFYLIRPVLVSVISLADTISFFPEDLTPGVPGIVSVLVGTPLLAAGAAIFSLRRVRMSPLGVARKATPKPPRLWRIVPLLAGLAILISVWLASRPITDPQAKNGLMPHFFAGSALVLFGLAIAGPWLTMIIARLIAYRARSAAGLLAFRRLADNPSTAFRAANVLVIAAFLCTFFAALTPILLNSTPDNNISNKPQRTILDQYFTGFNGATIAALQPVMNELGNIPNVAPVIAYNSETSDPQVFNSMLLSCPDFERLGETPCTPGKTAVKLSIGYGGLFGIPIEDAAPEQLSIPTTELQQHSVVKLLISIASGQETVERVRTVLTQYPELFGSGFSPMTPAEREQEDQQIAASVRYLVNGAFLIVLFVACCSLAVSVGGSLVERKRPFGLLRVSGTSLGQLRWVVFIESATPLLAAVIVASALGFGVAVLLAKSFATKLMPAVQALPADYYIAMGLGICIALAATLTTMPLLAAITKPENARFE